MEQSRVYHCSGTNIYIETFTSQLINSTIGTKNDRTDVWTKVKMIAT
jgi:hypothetical protein